MRKVFARVSVIIVALGIN
jgi:hypothetical protein